MSSPDRVLELKTKVATYEKEWQDAFESFSDTTVKASKNTTSEKVVKAEERLKTVNEIAWKLVIAYREYTKELEMLIHGDNEYQTPNLNKENY